VGDGCDHQDVESLVIHNKEGMYLKLAEMAAYVWNVVNGGIHWVTDLHSVCSLLGKNALCNRTLSVTAKMYTK
jgi:hypothetical protein